MRHQGLVGICRPRKDSATHIEYHAESAVLNVETILLIGFLAHSALPLLIAGRSY